MATAWRQRGKAVATQDAPTRRLESDISARYVRPQHRHDKRYRLSGHGNRRGVRDLSPRDAAQSPQGESMAKRGEALELAVLGLLHGSPLHGYELRKQLTGVLGWGRVLSFGSLYPCLKTL